MARTPRQPVQSQSTEFRCPECGRTFSRAAALGAHRRAHGVIGASTQARAASGPRSTTASAPTSARPASAGTAGATAKKDDSNGRRARTSLHVDRDALLQTIFPGGIPAKEKVMRAANAWLDEAE